MHIFSQLWVNILVLEMSKTNNCGETGIFFLRILVFSNFIKIENTKILICEIRITPGMKASVKRDFFAVRITVTLL